MKCLFLCATLGCGCNMQSIILPAYGIINHKFCKLSIYKNMDLSNAPEQVQLILNIF